jgi:hypothetical protein
MRRRLLTLCVLAGTLAALALAATAGAEGAKTKVLVTVMTGAAEVPGPGDPDGIGVAGITVNESSGRICWLIVVRRITLPATAAHIHPGAAGVAGPPLVTLGAPDANGRSRGCTTAPLDVAAAIVADPAAYYVNVHNTDFPAGALRGQLG